MKDVSANLTLTTKFIDAYFQGQLDWPSACLLNKRLWVRGPPPEPSFILEEHNLKKRIAMIGSPVWDEVTRRRKIIQQLIKEGKVVIEAPFTPKLVFPIEKFHYKKSE